MTPSEKLVSETMRAMMEAGDPKRDFTLNPLHEEEVHILYPIAQAAIAIVVEKAAEVARDIVLVGKPGSLAEATGRSDIRNAVVDALLALSDRSGE